MLLNRSWDVCVQALPISDDNHWMNKNFNDSDEKQQSLPIDEKYKRDYDNLSRDALINKIKTQEKHEKALLKHIEYLRKFYRKRFVRKNKNKELLMY